MTTQSLSPRELTTLISLLSRIDRTKPLGTELYNAIAFLSLNVAIEALTLRQGDKGLEIFLTKRSDTDTAYPGMWHSPGTIVRPTEEFVDSFKRLENREFKNNLKSWTFIENNNCPNEARGHFLQLLYLCEIEEDRSDNWFSVDNLPQPMVPNHQEVIIPIAVEVFKELHSK